MGGNHPTKTFTHRLFGVPGRSLLMYYGVKMCNVRVLSWVSCRKIISDIPFDGHIFLFMGMSSPSLCFHHSSPANLNMYQQTESEAQFDNNLLWQTLPGKNSFQSTPARSLGYPCAPKKTLEQLRVHTRHKSLKGIRLAQLLAKWPC